MNMRTPLKNARNLGSAKDGTDHFWKQRLTAVANLFLGLYFVALVVCLVGSDYTTVRETLSSPWIALPLLALILSGMIHMRLGMQTIIEDYIHSEGSKLILLMLNTFFATAVGLACVFAILKMSFGA